MMQSLQTQTKSQQQPSQYQTDTKTNQFNSNPQAPHNEVIRIQQSEHNQTTNQSNFQTKKALRKTFQDKNDSSDEGEISGRIENVSGDKKKKPLQERDSIVFSQSVYVVKKSESPDIFSKIEQKYINEQGNNKQSAQYEIKAGEQTQFQRFKIRQTHRGSIKQLKYLIPQYNQNIKNFQNNLQNKTPRTQQSTCYLELFQNKWEQVQLKITKNKVNIGPVTIDVGKILKIKIFPSELTEQSQQNIKAFEQDEKEKIKQKEKEKDKQKTKIKKQKSGNKIDKFFKKKLFGQGSKSSQSQKNQYDYPNEDTVLKIYKKNLIKLTTQHNNIYQFFQKYPTLVLSEPKQSYSRSTLPQPQTPNIGISSRLPAPFLALSRIILKKLKQLYPNIKSTLWELPQFPLRTIIHADGQFNSGLLKAKGTKNFAHIHGTIYKKSQIKGKWQKRYVIINQKGLFSFKEQKDEGYSFSIQSKSIKYMWTWFNVLKIDQKDFCLHGDPDKYQESSEIKIQQKTTGNQNSRQGSPKQSRKNEEQPEKKYVDPFKSMISQGEHQSNEVNQNTTASQNTLHRAQKQEQKRADQMFDNKNFFLIIKIKHGFNGQTQFAIPICGFDNETNKTKNWLFAFYKIISQYQY